ncbi:MAG: hypothetical protein IJY91_00215 [Oscillospiraceae bacterium]|nr:hypothetical protein [Oscillospiraceae bacterium]
MKSCFLFGHSDCPDTMLPKIEKTIENHYLNFNVRYFYVGNRGRFDSLAATAIKHLKQRYSDITLLLLLAYHPAERPVYLSEHFDNSYYPPLKNIPKTYAIIRANQYMVDTADTLICYVDHIGNTRNLLEYAKKREKKEGVFIENVAENF